MEIPKKRRFVSKYEPKLKIAIAREYLTSDLGYASLSRKYDIPKGTIADFISWYKSRDLSEIASLDIDQSEAGHLPNENELKITALELLIENASKELGIDLIKKFGTKQPKK